MGKQWKQCQTLFLGGSKITADGDCSHEIKKHLLLGRKVMTNLDSISKSRDITLPTKVPLPAPNSSQHQSLFQWVNSLHEVAKELEFQPQHQSFQWTPRTDLLQNGLVGSPCSPRDSQESSPTPQFKSINSLALSFLHSPTLASIHDHWKTIALTRWALVGKSNVSAFRYAI